MGWGLHSSCMSHSPTSWLDSVFPTTFKPTTHCKIHRRLLSLSHGSFNPQQQCGSIKIQENRESEKPVWHGNHSSLCHFALLRTSEWSAAPLHGTAHPTVTDRFQPHIHKTNSGRTVDKTISRSTFSFVQELLTYVDTWLWKYQLSLLTIVKFLSRQLSKNPFADEDRFNRKLHNKWVSRPWVVILLSTAVDKRL